MSISTILHKTKFHGDTMKALLTIILLLLFISLAQGAGESMSLGTFNININSAVEVPVLIGNATDVAGGKVTIGYNPSLVTLAFSAV